MKQNYIQKLNKSVHIAGVKRKKVGSGWNRVWEYGPPKTQPLSISNTDCAGSVDVFFDILMAGKL